MPADRGCPPSRSRRAPLAPRLRRPALAPGGLGRAGRAALARDHVRGRLPRHRQPAAHADRPGDRGRRGRARAGADGPPARATPAGTQAGRRPLHRRPAVQRELDAAVRAWSPARGTSTNRPELFGNPEPDNGESAAEQAQENRLSRGLLSAPAGYSTLTCPTSATCACSSAIVASRAGARSRAGDGRRGGAAGERRARAARRRARVHPGRLPHARRRAARLRC